MSRYELVTRSSSKPVEHLLRGLRILKERVLIGRSETCDVIIPLPGISAVHAVLEIHSDGARLYDMASTNGTYVNDTKIIMTEIQVGDVVRLANVAFTFAHYQRNDFLPPILEGLDPEQGEAYSAFDQTVSEDSELPPRDLPNAPSTIKEGTLIRRVFPLARDPKADKGHYLFEDPDRIHSIFRYELGEKAIEMSILFRDCVWEIFYIPVKDGIVHLCGQSIDDSDLELPVLRPSERLPFIHISGKDVRIHVIPLFDGLHLSGGQTLKVHKDERILRMTPRDIIHFVRGDVQLVLRTVDAPPHIDHEAVMGDRSTWRWIVACLLVCAVVVGGLQMQTVNSHMLRESIATATTRILTP